jgi:hypothetical protein
MSPFDTLLAHLDGFRRTGTDRGVALCPAHDDKGPSLAIRDLDDGRVLVHCFAGCSAAEVVGAVGLDLSALFPPRERIDHRHRRERVPFPAHDVLAAVGHEALVAGFVLTRLGRGDDVPPADMERAIVAAARLFDAAELSQRPTNRRRVAELTASVLENRGA